MRIYTGTFLVAFTTLALEVTLTRVFSVITWYHLSFFAIATALLGMTAGAVVVYLVPQWFTERIADRTVARACLAFAGTILLALITISLVPVIVTRSIMPALSLLLLTAVSALPFFFSGIAVTALLTKYTIPIGRLYASDLIGAATGSLFVLIGLLVFSAPSLIILCSALAVVASLIFGWKHSSRTGHRLMIMLALCIMVIAVVNSATIYGIRPLFFKGNFVAPSDLYLEKWNSFSQVSIFKENQVSPFYWGASPLAPKDITVSEHKMRIDGEAGTRLQSFSSFDDIDFLRYDVTNIGYYLRSQGAALIIGAGGGRDVQSALLFGHRPVVGVDVNPVFIDLLQNDFRDFAGLANRDDVKLVVDEGRSFAATTSDTFSIIEMSLIDTWAATGAGAFSLSENSLYTVEAWQTFLDRLTDDGIFTVSRWYNPSDLGETGRVVSLALAALLERGASNPAQHLAMVTTDRISTLLVSKNPFTPQDIVTLRQATDDLQFQLVMAPGIEPKEAFLKNLHAVKSLEELKAAIAG
ncbi:MAG: hypothetical protein K8J31_20920, partial [Anaerolineae bacterium]|nr:hypothetical protein [Anaerolineae bacterium]